MATDGKFLYQFVADFWDQLPSEDRDLFGAYWHSLTQIVGDLYGRAFEAGLSTVVNDVPVYKTERWSKYVLSSSTATITETTDSITLTGVTSSDLSKDAVLFETLTVSPTSGELYFEETITLVGTGVFDLTYDNITADTVRVSEGGAIFVPRRDYTLDLVSGGISRVSDAGIPNNTTVTVRYMHANYRADVDYTVDTIYRRVARTASSNIPSGAIVNASYEYDASTPDNLTGRGVIDATANTLNNDSSNFSGVLTGRTVTITSGANAGAYEVHSIVDATTLKITGAFVSDDASAAYSINAFPYAITAGDRIHSIPILQDRITTPTAIYREGVDYVVGDEKVSFRAPPPVNGSNERALWAEETLLDNETVYRNFGVLVDFYRPSSQAYLDAVRGIWYTYWTGSTHENLLRGMHILLGLPFAVESGTVTAFGTVSSVILNVSSGADITPAPIRLVPSNPADAITSGAPGTIVFPSAVGVDAFTAADIGKHIRITGSASNDGYYELLSGTGGTTASVNIGTTEGAGFTARIHEPPVNPSTGRKQITYFSYASPTFTSDDIGRYIRISGTTNNDGDYEIASIHDSDTVVIESVEEVQGPGGINAYLYDLIDSSVTISDEDGVLREYAIPSGLEPIVAIGDEVAQFDRLCTGVRIFDKNNTDNFVELKIGRPGVQRFLTQNASTGAGVTDETKALTLLMEHMFIAEVLTATASEVTDTAELLTFLSNLKPKWSEYIFAFAEDIEETLVIGEDIHPSDISISIDLTTILRNSWPNIAASGQIQYEGTASIGETTLRSPTAGFAIDAPTRFTATDGAFTDADVGRTLDIVSTANTGEYIIYKALSGTQVLVSPDFSVTEAAGAITSADVETIVVLTDTSATFTTDAEIDDVIAIEDGPNQGFYRVLDIVSDTVLHIREFELSGPFPQEEAGRDFKLISNTWFMDQGSIDLLENFLHESDDGATVTASTFRLDSSYDLYSMKVKVGFLLVVKAGANMGLYSITAITNSTDFTVSPVLPSSPLSSQDYSICQAGIVRSSGGSPVEALPI